MAGEIDSVKWVDEDFAVTSESTGVRAALLAAARVELVERGHAAISLRAVARRAGVSHAAPKHHFEDRAGLLTAIATEGFAALAEALRVVDEPDPRRRIVALGRAYVDFGLAHPALFDLMFRPAELHIDDPALRQAQRDSISSLNVAAGGSGDDPDAPPPELALICWALAHGLTVLTRDGALGAAAEVDDSAIPLVHHLIDVFAADPDLRPKAP